MLRGLTRLWHRRPLESCGQQLSTRELQGCPALVTHALRSRLVEGPCPARILRLSPVSRIRAGYTSGLASSPPCSAANSRPHSLQKYWCPESDSQNAPVRRTVDLVRFHSC